MSICCGSVVTTSTRRRSVVRWCSSSCSLHRFTAFLSRTPPTVFFGFRFGADSTISSQNRSFVVFDAGLSVFWGLLSILVVALHPRCRSARKLLSVGSNSLLQVDVVFTLILNLDLISFVDLLSQCGSAPCLLWLNFNFVLRFGVDFGGVSLNLALFFVVDFFLERRSAPSCCCWSPCGWFGTAGLLPPRGSASLALL